MRHVVCFGNLWRGDDGFGIHVLRQLSRDGVLPGHVRVIEGGVAGLQALPYFEGCQKAIVVDSLRSGGKVGAVHRLGLEEVCDPEREFSLHSFGVNHLLRVLPIYLGEACVPRVVIIGAEVNTDFSLSDKLSPILAASVNEAVECIIDECMS